MSVSSSVISRVIGRGGCNINAIRETTGAHIDIDTNRQKTTGSCIITIKGPADATRQAHQLIQALVKDPECDINDVLPRKKHLPSPTSRSATATTITTSVTSTVSHHRTLSEPKPNSVKTHSTTHSTQTRTTSKTTTAVSHQSLSNSWPSTNTTSASVRPQVTTSVSSTSAKSAAITSSTHMPSTARWATTTQTAASTNKKVPLAATQVTSTSSHPITAAVSSTTARKTSGGKANVSGSSGSGVVKPPTPAKRQLFPESSSSEVSRQATVNKTTRVVKGSPSYSSVAMGVTSSSGSVDGVTPVTTSSPLRATGPAITSLASSNLPPAISNILSHVGQTLSPSVWNDISHPSVRPNVGPVSDLDHSSSVSPADPITQPLYITTPGALFTPLPHEAPSSSPPNTSGSPVPTTTPTSTSPNSSPLGTSLAPGSTSVVESTDKPSLRPIGTERASRRISASPLPSVPGISPLIGTEGTQVAGVWSYSYAPDPTLSTGWSGAPATVSTAPSPPLISGSNSLPGTDEEHFRVNPGDTLQTFLERLSLSSHLGLFQKNEIDLDALLLMSEKDYADIGLPKGPRVKLLNSTRQLYTSDNQEFSAGPPGPSPSTRPVGRTPGWSPQGIIATSSPPTTVAAGVPYGAKRVPGRKVDTNKRQGWKSWSRTAV